MPPQGRGSKGKRVKIPYDLVTVFVWHYAVVRCSDKVTNVYWEGRIMCKRISQETCRLFGKGAKPRDHEVLIAPTAIHIIHTNERMDLKNEKKIIGYFNSCGYAGNDSLRQHGNRAYGTAGR